MLGSGECVCAHARRLHIIPFPFSRDYLTVSYLKSVINNVKFLELRIKIFVAFSPNTQNRQVPSIPLVRLSFLPVCRLLATHDRRDRPPSFWSWTRQLDRSVQSRRDHS